MKLSNIIPVLFTVGLMFSGCSQSGSVSNLSSSDPSLGNTDNTQQSPTTNTCAEPTTSVIWRGEKSTATTTTLRGAWSDVKIIPGTTSPASVYTDVGCACIKYTYWNGTSWSTEVISAGHTTSFTFIRLGYLSTGIPVVIWSNAGTTLQLAIRDSASVTAEANWKITNLDTAGTAIRAAELKVNPDDQVAILYARNTAGSSHLILCTTDCDDGANYSSPSTTLGTVGTNPHSLGLGWCNSGSTYYPVIALTGAANSSFAICRQSTLSSCLTGISTWAGGASFTLTGTGANRVTVQLAIDETTTDAPVRAIAQNGSGLAYYESSFAGGGCATGTIASITASGTISGTSANSGNAYLALERVSDNNYHLVANESTNGVRYYNTTSGTFTTWNPQGVVVSATINAAGSTRGGLAVDEDLSQAYTTFMRTAATGPFNGNLSFGWVEDSTLASNHTSAGFYETPFAIDGQLQLTTSQTPNVAIAATSTGRPATAFIDYSANAATTGILKYGYRIGSTASDTWNIRTIPVVAQPRAVALQFDADNKPWVGFFDQLSLKFILATNSNTDGTGTWSSYYFPFKTAATAATQPAFHSVALAFDKTTSGTTPVMIVGVANHSTVANTGVWSARLNPATGEWSNVTQIESTNAANSNSNVTADYNASGTIVVAYYDRSASNRVEYTQSVNGGVSWTTPTHVSSLTGSGMGATIKLNPTNSKPSITYYDRSNNRVIYSYCTSSIASCSTLGSWSYSYPENLTAGVSGLASGSDGLLSTGLTFTKEGTAYLVYPVGAGNTGSLNMNSTVSGTFGFSSVLVEGKNANTTSNTAISALNFAQPGWNVDSIRTSTGSLHSVYVGPGNWLYNTSCGN